jgi:hypothetical protein
MIGSGADPEDDIFALLVVDSNLEMKVQGTRILSAHTFKQCAGFYSSFYPPSSVIPN